MEGHFLGVAMLFIGMVLIVNALWLQGKVETKDVGVFNLLVGLLATVGVFYFAFVLKAFSLAGAMMLFAMTYLWVGVNALRGATDQRALGYYCLLVALVTIPFGIKALLGGDIGWTIEWVTYGILWYLFYQVLARGNTALTGVTVFTTFVVGIEALVTGWVYLYGYWPFGNWWPLATQVASSS